MIRRAFLDIWETAKEEPREVVDVWVVVWSVLLVASAAIWPEEIFSPLTEERILALGMIVGFCTATSLGLVVSSLVIGWAIEAIEEKTSEENNDE